MEAIAMTDRELLERAARAAGLLPLASGKELDYSSDGGLAFCGGGEYVEWNPLTDDGDAFRLAVKLGLFFHPEFSRLHSMELAKSEDRDELCVYRRAIVRAAAAMAGEG